MIEINLDDVFNRGEDLTPKRAFEQLGQAESETDLLNVLHNVILHFIVAVHKAKADDKTKAEAIFYLGEIEEAFFTLSKASYIISKLRILDFTERRLYNFMINHMATLIHMYAHVKYGNPLDDVISGLKQIAIILSALIAEYNMSVGSKIDELLNELESITAKE